jgi:hypothetical protein
MSVIDEKTLRRSEFAEGVKIRLCDGQEWVFPKPRIGLVPSRAGSAIAFGDRFRYSFGDPYNALVDKLIEAEGIVGTFSAKLDLATDLLQRNYSISDDLWPSLLPFWPEDPDNMQMWEAITEVALGKSPKPSPVG